MQVVPVDDLIEHDEWRDRCVCGPDKIEFDEDWHVLAEPVYVHHSLDGREIEEAGT